MNSNSFFRFVHRYLKDSDFFLCTGLVWAFQALRRLIKKKRRLILRSECEWCQLKIVMCLDEK